MEYRLIQMEVNKGHPFLSLQINGIDAYIIAEQKPAVLNDGYILIQPEEKWSKLLPILNYEVEGANSLRLESFLQSKVLTPIIIEMYNTSDIKKFNDRWAGRVFYEDNKLVIKLLE